MELASFEWGATNDPRRNHDSTIAKSFPHCSRAQAWKSVMVLMHLEGATLSPFIGGFSMHPDPFEGCRCEPNLHGCIKGLPKEVLLVTWWANLVHSAQPNFSVGITLPVRATTQGQTRFLWIIRQTPLRWEVSSFGCV